MAEGVPTPSSSTSRSLGTRKRVSSFEDDSFFLESHKRPRLSAMAFPSSYGKPNSIGMGRDRFPQHDTSITEDDLNQLIHYAAPLGDPTIYSTILSTPRRSHPSPSTPPSRFIKPPPEDRPLHRPLLRSTSSSSLTFRSPSPIPHLFPESSARHCMRNARITLDYSPPNDPEEKPARLLGCGLNNVAFFTRGNRVHYKNITPNYNDEVTQLCKLSENRGSIRALECNTKFQPEIMALGTSKGYIQLWDVQAKKATLTWPTTKDISALAWCGTVLTVGGAKGTIRHYDTRIQPVTKMKEQARKVTRHQARITCLEWSLDNKVLASGDAMGSVYCWEQGQPIPLNVGEYIHRRKKIAQDGSISDLSWCPWSPKVLATGDSKGILRFWSVNAKDKRSNALSPSKYDTGSVISGVYFSPHCKEILTTHGERIAPPPTLAEIEDPLHTTERSVTVFTYPSLTYASHVRVLSHNYAIGDSILNGAGTKLIFATPEDGKINVCDVWSKRKETKKRLSLTTEPSTEEFARSSHDGYKSYIR